MLRGRSMPLGACAVTEVPPPTSHLPQSSPGHLPCSSLIPLLRSSRRPSVSFGGFGLTNRETEVLRLVALSLDSRQLAEELHISEHTVLNHIRNARVKLNAANKLNAVLTARRLGLI